MSYDSSITQEWARLPAVGQKLEGLSRVVIYKLINGGEIRTKSIRQPGAVRGMRLVHLPSIRQWIEKQPDGDAVAP